VTCLIHTCIITKKICRFVAGTPPPWGRLLFGIFRFEEAKKKKKKNKRKKEEKRNRKREFLFSCLIQSKLVKHDVSQGGGVSFDQNTCRQTKLCAALLHGAIALIHVCDMPHPHVQHTSPHNEYTSRHTALPLAASRRHTHPHA